MIPKDNSKLERARTLRKEMTPQERHLWYDFLRQYPVKIYKQRIIGPYEEPNQNYDANRTAYLEGLGLSVVRFSNADINVRFRSVCEYLDRIIQSRL